MPLHQSLTFIKQKVEAMIKASTVETYLDSIGKDDVKEGVYVSLLYAEEEKTLKNNEYMQTYYEGNDKTKAIVGYANVGPKIYLNLYVLIVSTYTPYEEALKHISSIIAGFRNKNVYRRFKNDEDKIVDELGNGFEILDKLVFDIHTLNFEQNSSLWQSIGTKLYPYIVYKVRAIAFVPTDDMKIQLPVEKILGYVHSSDDPKNEATEYKKSVGTLETSEPINKKGRIEIINSKRPKHK